ncbi:hypothetical protein ONE63_001799 [Megalurothrips usitatus]|uniref:Uncharacterized protein n=1 Tax=Megalurothrips usitatus TaxID=439358 RepID=A0AAV7XCM5_9NEOP|nr:hypothetical protein ONE63_001799 [Megalurothrips usitatus]
MSLPAANMQKAIEAMEKAQTTGETRPQQIVVLPTYSMRFIIFMSVAVMMMITLFPVLVIRLVLVSSELSPFHGNQPHGAANLPVNVTGAPAWTQQADNATTVGQTVEVTTSTQSSTSFVSSEAPTAATSAPPAPANLLQKSAGFVAPVVGLESVSASSGTVVSESQELHRLRTLVKTSSFLKKLSV